MQKKRKIDVRLERTYATLFETFNMLLQEKNYSKISVTDITDKANIHRTTFYKHFKDKRALLNMYVKFCFNDLAEKSFDVNKWATPQEYYIELLSDFFNFLFEHKALTFSIITNDTETDEVTSVLLHVLKNLVYEKIMEVENSGIKHRTPSELLASVYSGALVSLILYWHTHKNISKETLINTLNIIIAK